VTFDEKKNNWQKLKDDNEERKRKSLKACY
jgi:hypothetical protein